MAAEPASKKELSCVVALKKKFPVSEVDPEDGDFLCDSTYLRFARARDGDIEKASEMLRAALEWRRQAKPYAITAETVQKAMEQDTMVCGGRCKMGCPVIAMVLGSRNDCAVEERTQQMIYVLEETQRKGYERLTWIIDFEYMGQHRDERSKATRKDTMKILQDYYPERMACTLLYRPPWYIRMLLGVVKVFMDARTAAKIYKAGTTIEELEEFVSRDQVPVICGGTMKGTAMDHLRELPTTGSAAVPLLDHQQ